MELRPAAPRPGRPAGLTPAAAAAAVVLALAACAPPVTSTGRPAAGILYVANGFDGTITRLDGATGRVLGPPLPAGPAPWGMATGPGGRLLVLASGGGTTLTHVTPGDRPGAGATALPVPLEAHATGAIMADDGNGRAAVVYRLAAAGGAPPGAPPCHLVLLDVAAGTIEATPAPAGR